MPTGEMTLKDIILPGYDGQKMKFNAKFKKDDKEIVTFEGIEVLE